jgi:hypothetical protein
MVTALVILLTLSSDRALPPPVAAAALREAAAIWAPYAVVLRPTASVDPSSDCPHILVDVDRLRPSRSAAMSHPLAAIDFEQGAPGSLVRVFLAAIVELLDRSERYSVGFDRWPIAAQDVFLGRALGRVIAHEVGHFLLGTRHAPAGLMRPSFVPQDLVEPSRTRFQLSPHDAERLSQRYPLNSQDASPR